MEATQTKDLADQESNINATYRLAPRFFSKRPTLRFMSVHIPAPNHLSVMPDSKSIISISFPPTRADGLVAV